MLKEEIMTHETKNELEAEFIDLGAVTAKTQGDGGILVPDAPQERAQTGILVD